MSEMFGRLQTALVDPEDDSGSGSAATAVTAAAESSSSSGAGSGDEEASAGSGSPKTDCPNDCSKRGKCKDKKCYCQPGFTTDDCSQSVEDYEKAVDVPNLVEKDVAVMFGLCFMGGCMFVGLYHAGSWVWKRVSNRYKGIEDSDDEE